MGATTKLETKALAVLKERRITVRVEKPDGAVIEASMLFLKENRYTRDQAFLDVGLFAVMNGATSVELVNDEFSL